MSQLSDAGRQAVQDIAGRAGVSEAAVMEMLQALQKGHGVSAQFNHPDLGGMGQWMRGGMTQVGDMFNDRLKASVNEVGGALAKALEDRALFAQANEPQDYTPDAESGKDHGGGWWPRDLGTPSATGAQNGSEYAAFPQKHRLAVRSQGKVRVYDSGEHEIGGFSQQQGGGAPALRFASRSGTIDVADLREVG